MFRKAFVSFVAVYGLSCFPAQAAPEAEVLHWWTSGGEARAMQVLKDSFSSKGGTWNDMAVAGGGGDAAMQALRIRVLAGNSPTAVQMKAPDIQEWFEEGALADISAIGEQEGWDKLLPPVFAELMKCDGKYCAAPVNTHRVDNLYANPVVLAKAGIAMPTTWEQFNAAADKLKAAGITPLAHGGQSWQDAILFENVVLGIGGADFYRKTIVELDDSALSGATMKKVFDQMRKLRGYVDANFSGRDWNLATAMVMNGEAAFQIMGDWAKSEFLLAKKEPGRDYLCSSTPGDGYIFNINSLAMFDVSSEDKKAGQRLLASLIMEESFQQEFALKKGSIPARLDVPLDSFDYCARLSAYDLDIASVRDTAVPSLGVSMAQRGIFKGAIVDVITKHFNSDMSSEDAANALAEAVNNVR